MNNILWVGAGGAIGSVMRYAISVFVGPAMFPYATLIVNVLGSLIIGFLLGLSTHNSITDFGWKFFAVGICGGFTTFSAFSLEGFKLIQEHRYYIFLLYIVASIIAGLLSTYAGFLLSK